MNKWERSGINVDMLNILVIIIIIYLVTCYIFMYLIKSNKTKPSKVSRMFYTDEEEFMKIWEKNTRKGKLRYVLYRFTINSIVILVNLVVVGRGLNLPIFCGLLTGNIIGLYFVWNMNQEKYYKLLNEE